MWIHKLLQELGFSLEKPMIMCYDNQVAIHIVTNLMFHERTKHIEVDSHFIREIVMSKKVITSYIKSKDQLGDMLTKALWRNIFFCYVFQARS